MKKVTVTCDRCEREIRRTSIRLVLNSNEWILREAPPHGKLELCQACAGQFRRWVEAGVTEAEKEERQRHADELRKYETASSSD